MPNPSTTTAIIERRSLSLGLAVGLFIEGFSLLWHFLVVKERANNQYYDRNDDEGHRNAVESVVALVLWSLISTAAPFVVLDHLRGLVLEESNDDDDELKSITQRLERMERRFGVGILLGVCSASAAMDFVLGFQGHFWFSLGIAGATAASCVLLPRLYRAVLSRQGQQSYSRQQQLQQQQQHPNQQHGMQAIDPETMNFVELTPGTLRLETL